MIMMIIITVIIIDEIFMKREPLTYTTARRAVQGNEKIAFTQDNASTKTTQHVLLMLSCV